MYAEILPFLLSIVFTAIVALGNEDSEIFPPSGANFLISLYILADVIDDGIKVLIELIFEF